MVSYDPSMLMSAPSVGLRDILMKAWDERWSAVKWCRLVSSVLNRNDGFTELHSDELCDILMEQLLAGDICSPLFVDYIVQAAGSNLVSRWKVFLRLTTEADPLKTLQFAIILSIIDSFVDYVYQNALIRTSFAKAVNVPAPSLCVAKVLLGTVHVTVKGMRAALTMDTRRRKHIAFNGTDGSVSDSDSDCDSDENEVVLNNATTCAVIVQRMCTHNRTLALLSIAKYEYPDKWAEVDREISALHSISDPASTSAGDLSGGVAIATKKRPFVLAGNDTSLRVHTATQMLRRGIFSPRPLSEVLQNDQGGAPRSSALAFHPRAIGHHCHPAIEFLVQMEICRKSLVGPRATAVTWTHAVHTMCPLKMSDLYASLILTCLKAIIYQSTQPGTVSTKQTDDKYTPPANENAENSLQSKAAQPSLLSLKTFLHVKIPLLIEQLEHLRHANTRAHTNTDTHTNMLSQSQPCMNGDRDINSTYINRLSAGGLNPVHNSSDTDNIGVYKDPLNLEKQTQAATDTQLPTSCAMDKIGKDEPAQSVAGQNGTTEANTQTRGIVAVEKAFERVCASQVLLAGAQACVALDNVAACLGASLVSKGLMSQESLSFSLRSHGLSAHPDGHLMSEKAEKTENSTDTSEEMKAQPDRSDELVKLFVDRMVQTRTASVAMATKAPPPVIITTKKRADLIGGALEANARVCLETSAGREIQEKGFITLQAILCGLRGEESCVVEHRAVLVHALLSEDVASAVRSVYSDTADLSARGEGMVKAWVVLMTAEWVREVVWALGLALDLRQILQSILDMFLKIEQFSLAAGDEGQSDGMKYDSEIYELCRLLLYVQHLKIQRFSATIVGGDTGGGLARQIHNPKISSNWIDLAISDPESAAANYDYGNGAEGTQSLQPLVEALAKAVYVTPTKENVQRCIRRSLLSLPVVAACATQLALRTCSLGGIEYRTVVEGLAVLTALSPTAHVAITCYLTSELTQSWDVDTWAPDHHKALPLPLAVLNVLTRMAHTATPQDTRTGSEDTPQIALILNSLVRECLLLSPSAAETMHSEHPMAHETTPASDITQNTLCPTLQAFVRGSALDPSTAIRLAQYTADANPAVVVEHSLQALMRIRLNASERVRLAYCSAQLYSRCPYALHTLCRVALTHYAMRLETVDQADALSVYISRAFACEYYGGLQAADNSYLRQCSNALFSLCVENLRDAMAHSTSDLRSYLVVQILTALSDMPQEVLAALDVPFSFLCDYVSAFGMEPILLCDLTHSQARKECADYYCQ